MNNYCSQKFWWLTVDPGRRQLQSCCAAYPHKIDINWLKNNPGQLFNTPALLQERQDMLDNIPVSSCEANCWSAEREGKTSRRIYMRSFDKTHSNIHSEPEMLHINLGSDCNLTCVYCTKQYSTAWLRDIFNNGPYIDEPRHQINAIDKITLQLGQKQITNLENYNLIIQELSNFNDDQEIVITGGEPFLHNNLVDIVKNLTHKKIIITTGLGISPNRFSKIIQDLPNNVEFLVSGENIDTHYEFVRYNNTYQRFKENFNTMIHSNKKIIFSSVISNLTIFNFDQFEKEYSEYKINLSFCNEPDYLSVNLLDEQSKEEILNKTFNTSDNLIKKSVLQKYTPQQKNNLVIFLKEFVSRRNLDLNIFPKHFINWLNTAQ